MKLIHCADLHLDSKMSANLDKEKAKERKAEILHTFERMIQYAVTHGIEGILIAGDLFDTKRISATARNAVLHNIVSHPGITFYYVKGNHDNDTFLSELEHMPDNLKLFGTSWTSYELGDIVIWGMELTHDNAGSASVSLILDPKKFNIVMMHGQEGDEINLRALKNKGIDYLALGHIHAYKKESLDARGIYCYCGCLEGRGFDECGEHGFVVIDVDEKNRQFTHEFVPFAKRNIYMVEVDVSTCANTAEMIDCVQVALTNAKCESKDLVKIVLTGAVDVECEKDANHILSRFKSQYYYVKMYDETTLRIDVATYLLDESLKGEFVRMVMNDSSVADEDKHAVIRYGLQALAGEEVQ